MSVMGLQLKRTTLISLIVLSVCLTAMPQAEADLSVAWAVSVTEKGEFITAYAHLYGVPRLEREYDIYFCKVELDATKANVPSEGVIEVSVGDYAQPAKQAFEITEKKAYTYGLNPTFNNKIAEVSSPTPVTVDLKITDKTGRQIYVDSMTIQMLPINYFVWVLGGSDRRFMSPVLATPHADPIFKILDAAARATPSKAMYGYQEIRGYNHSEIVETQMRAVYNVLQNLNLTYVTTDIAFTSAIAQRVKAPVQTLSDSSGNCIETTLLFGSIFEAIGLNVYYVSMTGHIFIAVGEWPGSGTLLCLETTMVRSETYDRARDVGFQTFEKVKNNDRWFYVLNVTKLREAGITPTPHLDRMLDGTDFYREIDEVSSRITSTSEVISSAKNALQQTTPAPVKAEERLREAEDLFKTGKYSEAKKFAVEAIQMINQTTLSPTPTPTPSKDETTDTIIGVVFLIIMPLAVVIFATLYVRGRKKKAVPKAAPEPAASPPAVPQPTARPPPTAARARTVRYCGGCGRRIALDATFCDYCGHRQRAA